MLSVPIVSFSSSPIQKPLPPTMKTIRSLTLLAAALVATHAAQATTYVNDVFNTGNYTNGALLGQDTPSWTLTSSTVNPLTIVNGNLILDNTGQDANQAFSNGANLTTASISGTDLYLSANINVTAAQATGDYFLHLSTAGATTGFFDKFFVQSSGSGFLLGFSAGGSESVLYGALLSFGTNYQIVSDWQFVSGGNDDLFAIYVNPTSSVEADNTPYLSYSWGASGGNLSAEPTNLSSVNFRQGSATAAGNLTVSSVTVTDTFPVGSSVPEPATYAALYGASALAVGAWRRSRRNL